MRPESTAFEYVLSSAEEHGVRFVRLWFVDVLGLLKSSSIPISELEQALTEGVGLDGSSLESGTRIFELDAIAHPDPTTFELLPWRPDAAVARMFCDIRLPDGSPSPGDSREALRRQLRKVAELGYTFPPSQANFIWLPLAERTVEFAQQSAEARVLVRPYGADGVRVTIGAPAENDAFLAFARQWISR